MKNKKILSLLFTCIVILCFTGCSYSEKSGSDASEKNGKYYTVTGNVALSYDLAYIDNIRSAKESVYVCGYSYISSQQYVFSVFDLVSGKTDDISILGSETGDVTAVYLRKDKFYAGFKSGKSTWFCIYDVKTGNEIKKISVEDNVKIVAFFEAEDGSLILDIRDPFGYGYADKFSSDYSEMVKNNIYEQISSNNMKISDMICYNSCYYVAAEENSVSERKINIIKVSEDGSIIDSYNDVLDDTDETYILSYINSSRNLCIVSGTRSAAQQITISEMQLSDGKIVNRYYDEFSYDILTQTDRISDCSDFVYDKSGKVFSYTTEEMKNTELGISDNNMLLYSSDCENKILLCSMDYQNSERPVIYQYDTNGVLIEEFNPEDHDIFGMPVKTDVLSNGMVCTLYKDISDRYYISWSDFKGNSVLETSVFDGKNLSSLNIWAGADGELYCAGFDDESGSCSIEVYNSEAQKIRSVSEMSNDIKIKEIFSLKGKDYILFKNESGKTEICHAENDKSDKLDNFSYPELDIEKIISCGDGSLCCFDADYAYKIIGNDLSGEKFISWSNSGITYKVEDMCVPDNNKIACLTSGNGYTLTLLERADKQMIEKLKKQKVITVGGVSISSVNFTEAVERFNNENPEYRICINDYLKYNGEEPDECISKLNLDIISGKTPDILIGSDSFDLKFYSEKGIFCDLNDFIDSDQEIQRTDFLENIFECYKTQEKQAYVPINFNVNAIIGKKSFLGSENGWTDDEFYKIASDKNMFYEPSASSLSEALLYADLSDYIDWENKKCSFTDGRFEKIAEYIYNNRILNIKYVSNSDYLTENWKNEMYYSRFSDNHCYTEFSVISSVSDLASLQNGTLNNEKIVLKGVPSVSASGPLIYACNTAGISSSSKNKDGAWNFMKILLSDEYQTKISSINTFPVKLSVFDEVIGNSRRTGFGYRIDGSFYDTAPLTENDVSEFADIVKNINHTYSCDSRIRSIMNEVLDEYFNGIITVNEAAGKIQNKVSLYLDEIR